MKFFKIYFTKYLNKCILFCFSIWKVNTHEFLKRTDSGGSEKQRQAEKMDVDAVKNGEEEEEEEFLGKHYVPPKVKANILLDP